jgi:hypothetical protein
MNENGLKLTGRWIPSAGSEPPEPAQNHRIKQNGNLSK